MHLAGPPPKGFRDRPPNPRQDYPGRHLDPKTRKKNESGIFGISGTRGMWRGGGGGREGQEIHHVLCIQ